MKIPVSFERPVATTLEASARTVLKVTNVFNAPADPVIFVSLTATGGPILIHSIVIQNNAGADIYVDLFDDTGFYAYAEWNETPAVPFTLIYAPGLDTATGAGNPALITRGLFPTVLLEGERLTINMTVAVVDVGSVTIYYEEVR